MYSVNAAYLHFIKKLKPIFNLENGVNVKMFRGTLSNVICLVGQRFFFSFDPFVGVTVMFVKYLAVNVLKRDLVIFL